MKDGIAKYKFKPGLALEFEILSVKDLYRKHKDILTSPHRADFYHILWIHKGSGTHLVDFLPVKFTKDSVLFINKGKVHFFDSSEKFEGTLILFTDNFFCRNEADVKFLHGTILFHDLLDTAALTFQEQKDTFYSILHLMKAELLQQDKEYHQDVLQNHLHNFLMLADREKRKQGFTEISKGADLDYTLLFNELLDVHFTKVRSVKEYADKIHISEKRLSKATAKILGKTPKEIINDRVLLEAKRLLVHTNQSIKEIGFQLGFAEPTNFIKYFKLQSGTTPSEFRESHL
ncbi:MAG TPA: AraC family transcriptional regulator [Ohtaekwangia sp.]|uniref:AraC family transcriptional regulator n=1 Tax=Ohtaekwangia sp. TaxID=2066019 RepID=UPI002F954611